MEDITMEKTFGFIGTGNMGSALARAAVKEITPANVWLSNRTHAKAEALAAELGCLAVNVKTVAEKYGGTVKVSYDEANFMIEVLIHKIK